MPEPAYRTLGRAIASVMDQASMTTVALADRLRDRGWKPDQSLISKWRQGHQRPHDIDIYPDIEEICGAPRGMIFRLAGYVDDQVDVVDAIKADPELTERDRDACLAFYEFALDRSAKARSTSEANQAEADPSLSSTR